MLGLCMFGHFKWYVLPLLRVQNAEYFMKHDEY